MSLLTRQSIYCYNLNTRGQSINAVVVTAVPLRLQDILKIQDTNAGDQLYVTSVDQDNILQHCKEGKSIVVT